MIPSAALEVATRRPLSFSRIQIAERVLRNIALAVEAAPDTETGEAMVGVVHNDKILILDTISPDTSAQRRSAMFTSGDTRQDEVLWWMQENWHQKRAAKMVYDAPLIFLGDWHKQPGRMTKPSSGDFMSAQNWMHDQKLDWLLVPIVTQHRQPGSVPDLNTLVMEDGLRLDMWMLTPESDDFERVMVTKAKKLPQIAPISWHTEGDTLARLIQFLESQGEKVMMTLHDADGIPPLEVCLMIKHPGSTVAAISIFNYDSGILPAQIRLAHTDSEAMDYEAFQAAWEVSEVFG